MDDWCYQIRMIFLSQVELSFHLFLSFAQRRSSFHKIHQQKLGWSWLGWGDFSQQWMFYFLLFGPTSSEHDPPRSSRETFCSSSGQKSSSLSLPGENRRASAAVELGKVQDSHTGKVDFGCWSWERIYLCTTHSDMTGLMCLLYGFEWNPTVWHRGPCPQRG